MRRKSQVVPNLAALAGLAAGILLALTTNGEAQQSISPQPAPGTQAVAVTLPADVYPDSGFRLPLPKREELDADGKRMYDLIVSPQGRTLAGLRGTVGNSIVQP